MFSFCKFLSSLLILCVIFESYVTVVSVRLSCCESNRNYCEELEIKLLLNGTYSFSLINLTDSYSEYTSLDSRFNSDKNETSTFASSFKSNLSDCGDGLKPTLITVKRPTNDTNAETTEYRLRIDDGHVYKGNFAYPPEEYCVDSVSESQMKIKLCEDMLSSVEACQTEGCLRKCCKPNEMYDLSGYEEGVIECVASDGNEKWSPRLYEDSLETYTKNELESPPKINLLSSPSNSKWCKEDPVIYSERRLGNEKRTLIRVLKHGTVLLKDHYSGWRKLDPRSFCIENAKNFPGEVSNESLSMRSFKLSEELIVVDCAVGDFERVETSNPIIYGVLETVASFFLLLTILTYIILWEKQNIHSWALLSYFITVFLMYVAFIATYFHTYYEFDSVYFEQSQFCVFLAMSSHFLYLSSFSWLTVVNFDIWWTFKSIKFNIASSKSIKRFICYALFAIGFPAAIVFGGFGLDVAYRDNIEVEIVRPEYGGATCSLNSKTARLLYQYGPVVLLLVVNLIFFLWTVLSIHKIKKGTKRATISSSSSSTQRSLKKRFSLFLKLFIVMGVVWTVELIFSLIFIDSERTPGLITYIVDALSILQPIAIFYIFVCKKDIVHALKQKIPFLSKLLNFGKHGEDGTSGTVNTDETGLSTQSSSYRSNSIISSRAINLRSFP